MSNFPHDDYVNVSDLTDRVDELRAELEAHHDEQETTLSFEYALQDVENFTGLEVEHEELTMLQDALDELRGNGGDHEWEGNWYPATLIADSYFTEAMQQLVEEIGDMPNGVPSYIVVDWEATAENLRVDYSSVVIDGTTYWYR